MARCIRCCLLKSISIINLLQQLCGVVMIVYSLWLLKKWQIGVSDLSTTSHLPKPWFVYTCLGVGIAVCLSTLFGHIVVKCIKNSILCIAALKRYFRRAASRIRQVESFVAAQDSTCRPAKITLQGGPRNGLVARAWPTARAFGGRYWTPYIVAIDCLLLLEVAVIIIIFFKFDWQVQLFEHIDEKHKEFKTFVIFNIKMCRWIVILILVPQVNMIVLAIILWVVGIREPRRRSTYLVIPNFNRSFLLDTYSPLLEYRAQNCRNCEILRGENPGEGLLSNITNTIRTQLEERGRHSNNINCN